MYQFYLFSQNTRCIKLKCVVHLDVIVIHPRINMQHNLSLHNDAGLHAGAGVMKSSTVLFNILQKIC